ncbi:MAG TPA: hypothetical protein VE086_06765, partial [Chthoniobacterales bacterium]|nr:hypothetical protein [Chthoniobacterales bacterium]
LNPANRENPDFGRLHGESTSGHWLYAFLRYDCASEQRFLVIVNLHPTIALHDIRVQLPQEARLFLDLSTDLTPKLIDRLSDFTGEIAEGAVRIAEMSPLSASYFEFLL